MLAFALCVGLGQLLAIGVHIGTWRLRRQEITMPLLGFVALFPALALLIAASPSVAVVVCLAFAFVGWLQSLQIDRQEDRFSLWLFATLALWGEVAVAFIVFLFFDALLSRTGASRLPPVLSHFNAAEWGALAFSLTLPVLALFRPLLLKLCRAVLRTARPPA